MSAIDIFSLLVPVTFVVFLGLEAAFPAQPWPARKGWRWLGIGFFLLLGLVSTTLPLVLPQKWLAAHRVLDLTGLGPAWGALVGYAALSLINALWHRTCHSVDAMWRAFHQIHHSPQRMDMSGSALFHPTEMIAYALISTAITTLVLGLDPLAAAITAYIAAFYGMFQHLNMRTPQWLGLIIQRPEAHSVHHQRGVHAFNYSDFPLWDIVMGSWRNPKVFIDEVGFDGPADRKVGAMLIFADVNAPLAGPGTRGQLAHVEQII